MAHQGPIQQFTECCMACGRNIYQTDKCVGEKDDSGKKKKKKKKDDWGEYPDF